MHYHLLLTHECNSRCRYCYEKSMKEENDLGKKWKFDFSCPNSFCVDVGKLKRFLMKDKDAALVFYGGEPLLEIGKIKEIMDKINAPFRMQTNGKLLDRLDSSYVNRIDKILISLDGDKERTDYNRGEGTYDKVIENIKLIKKNGYKGELIARMTISFPDLFEQARHLVDIGFTSAHWQLDAGFYKCDFNEEKFRRFVGEYNKSVSKLIEFWIKDMRENKRVLMFYPFVAIVDSLLKGEKSKLRCGAGHQGYAICADGKVVACPIMNCVKDFECGDLDSDIEELKKIDVGGRCLNCEIKDLCGGRCLYWNKAELWPNVGNEMICETIKYYIKELKSRINEIRDLISLRVISYSDFSYERYFGPEIIP